MAKYVTKFDISDPSLVITDTHCDEADVFVDGQLWQRGIDPADVSLPNNLLTQIAGKWAKRQAANDGAIGEDSPLWKKAAAFEKDALQLVNSLNKKSLGITTSATFGSITLGRG